MSPLTRRLEGTPTTVWKEERESRWVDMTATAGRLSGGQSLSRPHTRSRKKENKDREKGRDTYAVAEALCDGHRRRRQRCVHVGVVPVGDDPRAVERGKAVETEKEEEGWW